MVQSHRVRKKVKIYSAYEHAPKPVSSFDHDLDLTEQAFKAQSHLPTMIDKMGLTGSTPMLSPHAISDAIDDSEHLDFSERMKLLAKAQNAFAALPFAQQREHGSWHAYFKHAFAEKEKEIRDRYAAESSTDSTNGEPPIARNEESVGESPQDGKPPQ